MDNQRVTVSYLADYFTNLKNRGYGDMFVRGVPKNDYIHKEDISIDYLAKVVQVSGFCLFGEQCRMFMEDFQKMTKSEKNRLAGEQKKSKKVTRIFRFTKGIMNLITDGIFVFDGVVMARETHIQTLLESVMVEFPDENHRLKFEESMGDIPPGEFFESLEV